MNISGLLGLHVYYYCYCILNHVNNEKMSLLHIFIMYLIHFFVFMYPQSVRYETPSTSDHDLWRGWKNPLGGGWRKPHQEFHHQ